MSKVMRLSMVDLLQYLLRRAQSIPLSFPERTLLKKRVVALLGLAEVSDLPFCFCVSALLYLSLPVSLSLSLSLSCSIIIVLIMCCVFPVFSLPSLRRLGRSSLRITLPKRRSLICSLLFPNSNEAIRDMDSNQR